MKSFISLAILIFAFTFSAFAQEAEKAKPTEMDKTEAIPVKGYLKRGAPIGSAQKVSLAKVMKEPAKYAGKTVRVEGVIVRSCKKEGCWMEMAAKEGGKSVRVTFGDHAFFIPLNSAGMKVKAQGVFKTNVLSKEKVDHLINDDGAKFDNRNPDGTVTEVSFDATGVELTKAT